MGEGSPEYPTDIPPPPSDNKNQPIIHPQINWKIHPLTEQCALNRSRTVWSSPQFPAYNSNHSRLGTFGKWSHGMNPSPDSLSVAGFYFTGKNMF